jgi:hypothetical protein
MFYQASVYKDSESGIKAGNRSPQRPAGPSKYTYTGSRTPDGQKLHSNDACLSHAARRTKE